MKKRIVLALLLAAVSSAFAFAGGSGETTDNGKVQIVFWHRTFDDFSKEEAAFEAANPDIDVVNEAVGGDYDDLYTKYMTAIASNSLPNAGIVGQRHGIPEMYESGKLLVIEDYLPSESLDDVMPAFWGRFIYDGKRVCIPYSSSVPMLYYNADLFEEYGQKVPEHFEEIPAVAKALTIDRDGDGRTDVYGFNFNSDTPWYIQPWAWDEGAEVILADDRASVDNDGYRAVFEGIHQMVFEDGSMPSNQHSTGLDDFKNGYTAMFVTSSANLAQLQAGCGFRLGVAPFPGTYTALGGNSIGLFATNDEKELEATIRWISYLISLDGSLTNIMKGYLPIRTSFMESEEIQDLIASDPLRAVSIESAENIYPQSVNVADSTIWQETMDILSKVESDPDADIPALLADFQKTVDDFYNDYY